MSILKSINQLFKKKTPEKETATPDSDNVVVTMNGDEVRCNKVASIAINGVETPVDGVFVGIESVDDHKVAVIVSVEESVALGNGIWEELDELNRTGTLEECQLALGDGVIVKIPSCLKNENNTAIFEVSEVEVIVSMDELREIAALLKNPS